MLEIDYKELNKVKVDKYNRVSGIFAINKPQGLTSHDIVDKIRQKLKTKKVGHAGALDPFATGVLIIMVGKYTKKSELLINMDKEYTTKIIFGVETDTLDIDGQIISSLPNIKFNNDLLSNKIEELNKKYFQYVPIFSSVKVNGNKLRELARSSDKIDIFYRENKKLAKFFISNQFLNKFKKPEIEIEIPGKEVKVKINVLKNGKLNEKNLKNYNLEVEKGDYNFIDLNISCSKGTYIRQIAEDLAEQSNMISGTLLELCRTRVGQVDIVDAIDINDLLQL